MFADISQFPAFFWKIAHPFWWFYPWNIVTLTIAMWKYQRVYIYIYHNSSGYSPFSLPLCVYIYIHIYIYIYSSLVLHIHYLTQCQYPIEIHYLNQLHPMNILQSYPLVQSAQLRRFPHFSQLELHFIPIRDLGLARRRAACLKNLMKNHQGWINIWGLNWFNQKKKWFHEVDILRCMAIYGNVQWEIHDK